MTEKAEARHILAVESDRPAWESEDTPADCRMYERRRAQSLTLAERQLARLMSEFTLARKDCQ